MPYRHFNNNTNNNNNNNNNNNRYNNHRNPNRSEATHKHQWNQDNNTSKDYSFDGFREKDHFAAHSGRKRPFPFSDRPGFKTYTDIPESYLGRSILLDFSIQDHTDNGGVMKLYIANVPRRAIEDDIRPLFEEHGNAVEISFIRDKTSGQRRGCCFVKYSTSEDAERAIKALDRQYTFPGEYDPIQVRYANGPRLHSMQDERKLYVFGLHKQATENEIAEIFSTYGRVEDVCILRDEMKQSLGRGFVEFMQKDMALAAINALNGTYVMTGCDQPLVVRFANPRKPKTGESRVPSSLWWRAKSEIVQWLKRRNDATFQGSGFGPQVHTSLGIRPESNDGNPTCLAHTQPNGWKKTSPQSSGPTSQAHDFASHSVAKNGDAPVSMATSSKHPVIEVPSGGQLLPLEKPLHPSLQLVPYLSLRTQGTPYTSQMKTSLPPVQQLDQLQIPTTVGPCSQALPSEHLNGNRGHPTQLQSQESTFATAAQQISLNVQTEDEPSTASQKQLCDPAIQQEMQKPLEKSSNQLPEVLPPQLSKTATQEPKCDDTRQQVQQSSFTGNMQQAAASPAIVPTTLATSSTVSIPPHTLTAPPTCEWSEHICPDGFKYYYNCITKKSRWEKPKELIFSKEQQLKLSVLRAHIQSRVEDLLISTNSACQMHLTTTKSASRGWYNGSGQPSNFYRGSSLGSNRGNYGYRGCDRCGWSEGEGDQVGGWGNQVSGSNRKSDNGWNKGKPHGDNQSSGWSNGDTQSYGWSKGEGDQVGGWGNQGSGNNRASDSGWNKGKPHGDDQSSRWSKDANADANDQVGGWGNQCSGNNRASDSGWNKGKPHGDDQSSGWSKDANADADDQVGDWGSQVSWKKDTCNCDWNGEKPHADNESFGWRTQISGDTETGKSEGWAGKQSESWNQSNVAGKTVLSGWNKTIGAKGETNKSVAQEDDPSGKAIMNSWGEENSGLGGNGAW